MPRVLGVIPARFASTRFPGKPLAPLGDRTLVEQVWRRTVAAQRIDRVVIATDDERIACAARGFGAEVMLTSASHASGTDRVAEVAAHQAAASGPLDVVVNVQGDEPLVTATSLDRLVEAMLDVPRPEMATLAEPFDAVDDLTDPNTVKVVVDATGRALYFSRAMIPFYRGTATRLDADCRDQLRAAPDALRLYRRHQGVYAYTADALLRLTDLAPSPLERAEGLEQLRALEAGFSIRVLDSDFHAMGVDTPADLERVARLLAEASS